jgi:hypothetical protein
MKPALEEAREWLTGFEVDQATAKELAALLTRREIETLRWAADQFEHYADTGTVERRIHDLEVGK